MLSSYPFKTFAHSHKSQNLHFSVTSLLITFFARVMHFLHFSTDSKSALNSAFFDTHIECLKKIGSDSHFLLTLKSNSNETAQKNEKMFLKNWSSN